jgi:hypothetical protein
VQDEEKEVSSAASKFILEVECRLPICDVKPIFEVATWVIYPPNLPTWVITLHCCSVRYNLVSILGTHFQKMGLPKTTNIRRSWMTSKPRWREQLRTP